MLVTTKPQRTLWEAVLPLGHQDLPAQLARVDALLDDPVFFEPYLRHFSAVLGPDRATTRFVAQLAGGGHLQVAEAATLGSPQSSANQMKRATSPPGPTPELA